MGEHPRSEQVPVSQLDVGDYVLVGNANDDSLEWREVEDVFVPRLTRTHVKIEGIGWIEKDATEIVTVR
jgi:hypothetical protein